MQFEKTLLMLIYMYVSVILYAVFVSKQSFIFSFYISKQYCKSVVQFKNLIAAITNIASFLYF